MKPTAIAVAILCGGAASFNAAAGEYDSRVYLAPGMSYTLADSDRKADDAAGAFFGLGKPVTEHFNLEIAARANDLDLESGKSKFSQRALMLDGLFFLDRKAVFAPYAVAGAGVIRTAINGGASKNLAANAGIGALYSVGKEGLGIRADVRYRMDFDNNSVAGQDNFGDIVLNLGLVMPLGKSKSASVAAVEPMPVVAEQPAPVVVAAPVAPKAEPAPIAKIAPAPIIVAVLDGDKDGVPDASDNCANTRAGAKVDAKGCEPDGDSDGITDAGDACANTPAGIKVDAMGCEVDSDSDKIADSRDQCANTPAGVKVDAMGCALDSDADGIADASDACANTKAGIKVDDKGCAIPKVAVANKVQFGFGTADLNDQTKKALDAVAVELKANPDSVAQIAGFTDAVGSESYNKKLSEERAQAVRDYLSKQGVSAATLRIQGFGEERPIASNETDTGRAQNRRVEVFVTNE